MAAHTLEEVHDLFRRFMREGDINAVLTLYDREVVFCTRAGELKHGRDALREELAPLAAMKADFQFSVTRKIESGETALVHNQWTVRGPKPQSGYAIEVFRRRAGMWRFLIGDPYTIGDLQTADEASRTAELTAR